VAIVAVGLYAVTSMGWDDDEDDAPRKGKITCWWTPSDRPASISWRFGRQVNGTASPSGATKATPFVRNASNLRVGDVVSLNVTWPGTVVGPGLLQSCTIVAGHTTKPIKRSSLARISELVAVT
jgi:hypothetical protein